MGESEKKDKNLMKFLGTAGARFVVARQLRYSGGTFLRLQGQNLMIDPGPGTLVRCARSRPKIDVTKLDALLLTHAHIDHSNDVNILADAMMAGGFKKRGALFCPSDCLEGEDRVVLNYIRPHLERIETLEAETSYSVGPVQFHTTIRHRHSVETYGLKFEVGDKVLAFMVDSEYFPELAESYAEADILVINVVRKYHPEDRKIQHLSVDEASEIIAAVKPEQAIITHFGMTMVKAKPWEVAQRMTDDLGIPVKAASDGMNYELPD